MKNVFLPAGIVMAAAISLSSCMTTSADGIKHFSVQRTVVNGERTRIGFAYNIAPDCSVLSAPNVRILKTPQHGKVESVREYGYPRGQGEHKKCNSTKVLGLAGYYTPDQGFSGRDSVTARLSFGDGYVSETVVGIRVLK